MTHNYDIRTLTLKTEIQKYQLSEYNEPLDSYDMRGYAVIGEANRE